MIGKTEDKKRFYLFLDKKYEEKFHEIYVIYENIRRRL